MRGGGEDAGGRQHADRRQRHRRAGRLPECAERRAEAGIEQDDGQRQRADDIGDVGIVELDAEPVGAAGKSDAKEEKQQGRAEAEGDQARKRGGEDQRGGDQRYGIECLIHSDPVPRIDVANPAPFVP